MLCQINRIGNTLLLYHVNEMNYMIGCDEFVSLLSQGSDISFLSSNNWNPRHLNVQPTTSQIRYLVRCEDQSMNKLGVLTKHNDRYDR